VGSIPPKIATGSVKAILTPLHRVAALKPRTKIFIITPYTQLKHAAKNICTNNITQKIFICNNKNNGSAVMITETILKMTNFLYCVHFAK
jgi:hypothetical protein